RLRAGGILGGNLQLDQPSVVRRIDVLFAVNRDELVVADEHDVRVDAGPGKPEAPDSLTGAGIHADDVTAARALIKHALVAEIAVNRRGKGAVDRLDAGGRRPHEFAGFLVEG